MIGTMDISFSWMSRTRTKTKIPLSFFHRSHCERRSSFSCSRVPSKSLALTFNGQVRGRQFCGVSNTGRRGMDADAMPTAQISETFFRNVLGSMEKIYLTKNPTASSIVDLVRRYDGGQLCYDHFAFRTFNVDGCGISAMAQFFLDFGYVARDELRFPKKHLRALWFSPPEHLLDCKGEGVSGPLPRIFISELLVDKLSPEAQAIIKKYTSFSAHGNKYAALASVLGSLTWPTPLFSDYKLLARESEYAAWTLVNGYALNHLTISVHRLKSEVRKIERLNEFIQSNKFKLNTEGGILKISPDGRLLQSSTVADSMLFNFAEGTSESVPASYIEFAERLVLPEYGSLPAEKISEWHRRDGFEVGSADKIFESTSSNQLSRTIA
uniref:2-oxoadipate dioxygenase/decarboxylase n=1 Tax=Araucaria cunninghamii TaxID=56994 RepID=A0A0D6QWC2_ARACU